MRKLLLLLVALAVVCAHGGGEEEKNYDDSDVLKLTHDNFQSVVDSSPFVVVKFFAPWCGHCKHLAPEYAKAATMLKTEQPPIVLADVDATVEEELARRFQVSGYPTLKIFKSGQESSYEGPRDAAGIVKYLKAMNGPAAKTITSLAQFDEIATKKGLVFTVGFFAEAGKEIFNRVAESMRSDYTFYLVTDPDIILAKNSGKNGVVTYRTLEGETPIIPFAGDWSNENAVKEFIRISSVPLAGVYTDAVAARYGLPRVTLFAKADEVKDPSGVKYFLNRLRKAAGDFVGKLSFVLVDKSNPDWEALNYGSAATGMAVITPDGKKYKADTTQFTVEAAKQVAQSFLDGKLDVYVKSQPIPADNSKPVKVIVGKTFQKEVMQAEEDVFIKFYAPWCGHCKHLAPVYEELASHLSKHKTLKIVEYDATENDVPPEFNVRGFPTLYLLRADDKAHPVAYDGDREVAAMESWLREHVSQPLKDGKEDKKKEKKEKKEKKKDKKEKKEKDEI